MQTLDYNRLNILQSRIKILKIALVHMNCANDILAEANLCKELDEDLRSYLTAARTQLLGDKSIQWFIGGLIDAIRDRLENDDYDSEEIWEHA